MPAPRRCFYAQRIAQARITAGAHRRSAPVQQRVDGYWHPRAEAIDANERTAAAYTTLYHREMGWTR